MILHVLEVFVGCLAPAGCRRAAPARVDERRRRERVRSPPGVCTKIRCRRSAEGASTAGERHRRERVQSPAGELLSSERSERRRKQTARAQRGSFALTRRG